MTSLRSSPDRFTNRFLSKYSPPAADLCSERKMESLECSEVKDNPSSEQMLGASEVSWLQKIEEENRKTKQGELPHNDDNRYLQKQTNSMKFSFNKNDIQSQLPASSGNRETSNEEPTLKQIYYQEFQKQSESIKNLQQERTALLLGITDKKKSKIMKGNKENLIGSIKRYHKGQEKQEKALQGDKSKTKSTIEQRKFWKDDQQMSLKYLQDSLAKKSPLKIPLSKLTYLQESKTGKEPDQLPDKISSVKTKEFDETEEIITSSLELLFDQLDKLKMGKLFSENCDYQAIREQFKIAFGYVLVRIMFKDLMMNKEEFVMLGLQVLKQLDSVYINSLVKQLKEKRYDGTQRTKQIIKRKDNLDKKNVYRNQNQKDRRNSVVPEQKYFKEMSKFEDKKKQEKNYTSVPIFKENLSNQIHFGKSDFKTSLNKIPYKHAQQYQLLSSYREKNEKLQKDAELCYQYLLSFQNKDYGEAIPSITKKIRNISEEMILEHKKNLEFLIRLNESVENYLSRSRRRIEQISHEKHYQHTENTLITDRYRNSEWMSQI